MEIGVPQATGGRGRRPSILDAEGPPRVSELEEVPVLGGPPGSRARARTNSSVNPPGSEINGNGGGNGAQQQQDPAEMQNARALEVLDRVQQKLTGRDFKPGEELDIVAQVNKLIMEATKLENLCQHYIGWCSFW